MYLTYSGQCHFSMTPSRTFNQGINHSQHDLKVNFKEDPGLWLNWRSIIGAN